MVHLGRNSPMRSYVCFLIRFSRYFLSNKQLDPENEWLKHDPFLLEQFGPIFRGVCC